MKPSHFRLFAEVEREHWWFAARRHIFGELIAQVLPPGRKTVIVDVGCGTGGNLASFAEDYDCVGIDPSPEAIELARQRFPQCRFLCGQAPDDLGEVAEQASLFTLNEVLEHVADDFSLLSRLLAVARPGTYFLVTVPADQRLWSPHDESTGHYRRYSRERFEQLWQDLPVTAMLVSHYNSRLYLAIRLVRRWNRWRGKAGGEAHTDVGMPPRMINRALQHVFSGEGKLLGNLLQRKRRTGYRHGVSLIALLQREAGDMAPVTKPGNVAADYYDPLVGRPIASGSRR